MKNLLTILFLTVSISIFAQKDSVLIQEASFKYEIVEAVYEIENIRIMKRAASSGGYITKYEVATESVMVTEASFTYYTKPPVYKTITKEITNSKGETIEIRQKIVETPASFEKVEIPAKYKTVSKLLVGLRMEHTKPKYDPNIPPKPAEYQNIPVEKIKSPARLIRVEIPAVYQYI